MPSEGESPSAGWREVYDAMDADPADPDDGLRADGRGGVTPPRERLGRCPDCKASLGLGSGTSDLCCDAHLDRLRAADGRRPD